MANVGGCRWRIAVAIPVVAWLLAATSVAVAAQPCAPGEGAPVQTRLGLTLCDGVALASVLTHTDPQPGARVAAVAPGSLAEEAGLHPGDVIYQIAARPVKSGTAAAAALDGTHAARPLLVNFWRGAKPYLARVWLPNGV